MSSLAAHVCVDVTAACLETGRTHFGPSPEKVLHGHDSVQRGEVKLVMEMQISAAWFDEARPKVPVEKQLLTLD